MDEVSGPIMPSRSCCARCSSPSAFISGLTGQFYRQFAITIAISTVISAFNSLTLSPGALGGPARAHGAQKTCSTRLIDRAFGWFFRPFNRFFAGARRGDTAGSVRRVLRRHRIALVVYAGLLALTCVRFAKVPERFRARRRTSNTSWRSRSCRTPPRSIARTPSSGGCRRIALETPGRQARHRLSRALHRTASRSARTRASCSSD